MYTVLELQTNNGQTSVLTFSFTDRDAAESKYHSILSYAAVSQVEIHAASIIDAMGSVVKNEGYSHPVPPNDEETASQE